MEARRLSKSVISRVTIRVTPFRGAYNSTYNPLTKSPGPPSKYASVIVNQVVGLVWGKDCMRLC